MYSVVCLSECNKIYSVPFLAADQVVGVVWYFVCLSLLNETLSVPFLAEIGHWEVCLVVC